MKITGVTFKPMRQCWMYPPISMKPNVVGWRDFFLYFLKIYVFFNASNNSKFITRCIFLVNNNAFFPDAELIHNIKEIQKSITMFSLPENMTLIDYGRLKKDGELKVQSHESGSGSKLRKCVNLTEFFFCFYVK